MHVNLLVQYWDDERCGSIILPSYYRIDYAVERRFDQSRCQFCCGAFSRERKQRILTNSRWSSGHTILTEVVRLFASSAFLVPSNRPQLVAWALFLGQATTCTKIDHDAQDSSSNKQIRLRSYFSITATCLATLTFILDTQPGTARCRFDL